MKTETRQYKNADGNPVTLDWLVKNEPEWASNQIRHRDELELALNSMKGQVQHGISGTTPDLSDLQCSQATKGALPDIPTLGAGSRPNRQREHDIR